MKRVLIATAIVVLCLAGCQEKEPSRDMKLWDIVASVNESQNKAIASLQEQALLQGVELDTATDVNGINLNLLKRVSHLETKEGLFGYNYMDNKARLDNLEFGNNLFVTVAYDPNDAIYKFIPVAGDDWIEQFGDTDDTRMKHTVSELRVVVASVSKRLLALENQNVVVDPNDVKK